MHCPENIVSVYIALGYKNSVLWLDVGSTASIVDYQKSTTYVQGNTIIIIYKQQQLLPYDLHSECGVYSTVGIKCTHNGLQSEPTKFYHHLQCTCNDLTGYIIIRVYL